MYLVDELVLEEWFHDTERNLEPKGRVHEEHLHHVMCVLAVPDAIELAHPRHLGLSLGGRVGVQVHEYELAARSNRVEELDRVQEDALERHLVGVQRHVHADEHENWTASRVVSRLCEQRVSERERESGESK